MALPAPQGVSVTTAYASFTVAWQGVQGAASYTVLRSVNGGVYSTLASGLKSLSYVDTAVPSTTWGQTYAYEIEAVDSGNNPGTPSSPVSATAIATGQMTLGMLRTLAKERINFEESDFVTDSEWNSYLNQSRFELYDLLVQHYGDEYFMATPYQFTLSNGVQLYPLPADFYKLKGVDLGVNSAQNAWITLYEFQFIARNRYIFANSPTNFLGAMGMKYRIIGNQIMLIPPPAANQIMQIWYVPRLYELVNDNDIADGISGWNEYVVVDACIKARDKQESDVSVLVGQKQALLARIESAASSRDAGIPQTISRVRQFEDGGPFGGFDGPIGGF